VRDALAQVIRRVARINKIDRLEVPILLEERLVGTGYKLLDRNFCRLSCLGSIGC
jgi:hypothetical protein